MGGFLLLSSNIAVNNWQMLIFNCIRISVQYFFSRRIILQELDCQHPSMTTFISNLCVFFLYLNEWMNAECSLILSLALSSNVIHPFPKNNITHDKKYF